MRRPAPITGTCGATCLRDQLRELGPPHDAWPGDVHDPVLSETQQRHDGAGRRRRVRRRDERIGRGIEGLAGPEAIDELAHEVLAPRL